MRRLRNDLPYTFRPPMSGAWLRPLGLAMNRAVHLSRKYRIAKIHDQGFERVRELGEAGHAILLAPNHSDHSDPHVVMELAARCGMNAYFMGAREIFEVSSLAAWALQSMGVFSVDRDGPDLSAIKTAITLLEKGADPLVIFPEGEIYHHHRRLDPLNEGVASILLKAAARMPDGKHAYLVPVGLRFFHDPSVEATFRDRLSKLEDRIGWTPKPLMPVDDRILRDVFEAQADFLREPLRWQCLAPSLIHVRRNVVRVRAELLHRVGRPCPRPQPAEFAARRTADG